MNAIKQRLLTDWHLVRIVRLGIGVMMLVMGIQARDWAMGLFSGFFLYQAITNTGCCGSGRCATPNNWKQTNTVPAPGESITEYEEIK
jgi:hypothetical protein